MKSILFFSKSAQLCKLGQIYIYMVIFYSLLQTSFRICIYSFAQLGIILEKSYYIPNTIKEEQELYNTLLLKPCCTSFGVSRHSLMQFLYIFLLFFVLPNTLICVFVSIDF